MSTPRILLADDEQPIRRAISAMLTSLGYEVTLAESGDEAWELFQREDFDLVLTDVRMQGMDGLELVGRVRTIKPEVPTILVTAFGTVDQAVEAMRRGADDFVTKPISPEELRERVAKALARAEMSREISALRAGRKKRRRRSDLVIGSSRAIRAVLEQISLVARNDVPVTLYGESGTGKELLARTIHAMGPRADKPFVPLNCGSLPETLLESELFGHVRGAFTGASSDRSGLFVTADGGVLFLDEIGEMAHRLQVGLLRVLQAGEVRPVGGDRVTKVNVRIIAATNRPLREMVAREEFREDLFYRIDVLPLTLPPLRERLEDLPELVDHFRLIYNTELGKAIEGFTPGALLRLREHSWPGNVRELQNIIKQAMVVAPGPMVSERDLFQFSPDAPPEGDPVDLARPYKELKEAAIRRFECGYVERLLTEARGKVTRAAEMGGMDRKSLWALLRKHDIDPKKYR